MAIHLDIACEVNDMRTFTCIPKWTSKVCNKSSVGSILTSAGLLQDAYQGFIMITFYKHYSWYNNNCYAKNCESTKHRKTRKGILWQECHAIFHIPAEKMRFPNSGWTLACQGNSYCLTETTPQSPWAFHNEHQLSTPKENGGN